MSKKNAANSGKTYVSTQDALNRAPDNSKGVVIQSTGDPPVKLVVRKHFSSLVITRNSLVEVYGDSHCMVTGNAHAILHDKVTAGVEGHASVEAYDDVQIALFDNSVAEIYDRVIADAYDSSRIMVKGNGVFGGMVNAVGKAVIERRRS